MGALTSYRITTNSAEQTRLLGRHFGALLPPGAILRLTGTLGSGKTCFVQGLARGLGVHKDYDITSPTYTLVHEYPGRTPLIHADLYRIADEMDAESVGLWDFMDSRNIVAVEWAERIDASHWPPGTITIEFEIRGDETRDIKIFGYGLQLDNLIKEVLASWEA